MNEHPDHGRAGEHERPDGPSNGDRRRLSRREVLIGAGAAGAGLLAGGGLGTGITLATSGNGNGDDGAAVAEEPATTAPQSEPGPPPRTAPLQSFTVAEAAAVGAVVARLIGSDDDGSGAEQAGVVGFIDGALAGELRGQRALYSAGLRSLDAIAREREGARFEELSPEAQDEMLRAIESGEVEEGAEAGASAGEGAVPTPVGFFEAIREHTLQGMFGDPVYGGNQDFAGWRLLGYPGVKYVVPAGDQELDAEVELALASGYGQGNTGVEREEG